jgi:carboxymethylenebutenolidase
MAPGGGGTAELGGRDGVGKAIRNLPPDQITGDLNAVAEYLSKLPSCNGKIVVGGFCWGGGQTFRYATNNKKLKGAFPFYGTGPTKEDEIKRIECPVFGFYGGNDNRVTSTVEESKELMKKAGKKYEPVVYEGAGHGFMRAGEDPSDNNPANKKAHDEAWKRWKDLLKGL